MMLVTSCSSPYLLSANRITNASSATSHPYVCLWLLTSSVFQVCLLAQEVPLAFDEVFGDASI